jgi:hypothetical protein
MSLLAAVMSFLVTVMSVPGAKVERQVDEHDDDDDGDEHGVLLSMPGLMTAQHLRSYAALATIRAAQGLEGLAECVLEVVEPVGRHQQRRAETLTRAAEFGPASVRVNAISPGVVRIPSPADTIVHPGDLMMKGTPAGTVGSPDAVASADVYLASDEASFVHGIVLDVDGGRTTTAVMAA